MVDRTHCLSRSGHHFRLGYRHVGQFRESAGDEPVPAGRVRYRHSKLEVVGDTTDYFQKEPGVELRVFDGGACRPDLEFVVLRRDIGEKLAQIHEALRAYTPDEEGAGHRVLRDTEPLKGVGCIPAGQGGKGGALSRWLSSGDQEERAG